MKVLYFTSILQDEQNGGHIGLERNLAMVRYVFGYDNVDLCPLYFPSKLQGLSNYLLDRSLYSSRRNDKIVAGKVADNNYDIIFLNGPALYKYLEQFIKKQPIVFLYCHNVEYYYYREKFKLSHSISDFMMSRYIKKMESYTVKNSSIISALNERDSIGLSQLYGRHADFILPIAMNKKEFESLQPDPVVSSHYGLFVGSSIGPNVEGLEWFFANVAPFTPNVNYEIVGSCCKTFRNREVPENVNLRGRIDDLDSIYRNASFVICPIFSGSGMKTKTIEALRYGKTVIGTQEAFEGIDVNYDKVGIKTNNPEEQIQKINSLDLNSRINENSIEEFNNKFTYEVIFEKFRNKIIEFANDYKK